MPIDLQTAVLMVKQRKDMLTGIHQRDDYITARVQSVISELENKGIHLVDTTDDLMLVVDMTVWQYNNRDQGGAMPEWMRMLRYERWMNDRRINEEYAAKQVINRIMERLRNMDQTNLESVLSYVEELMMEVIAGDP